MLKTYLETSKQSIEHWLSAVLNSPIPEYKRLYESMNYSYKGENEFVLF